MTKPVGTRARLPFRVEPMPLESPRGYFCRVASVHRYDTPLWLMHLAGISGYRANLDRQEHWEPIAHALRLDRKEWLAMCYGPVKGIGRFSQRMFCGQTVRADQFNYRHPRICPHCLRERAVWWAIWDLALVAACPLHRSLLINQCPACGKKLVWQRPAVEICCCEADLRRAPADAANADLLAMNALIYRAAGFPPSAAAEFSLGDYRFPPELLQLPLGHLLCLIRFLGRIMDKDRLRWKQRPFPRTDITNAIQAGQYAIVILRDWPWSFREILRRMLPPDFGNPNLNFSQIFGNFYRHVFHVLPRREFGFLHAAFERFVIEEWKGLIRGHHCYFWAATRQNSHWVTANEAEQLARTYGDRIAHLVRKGQLEGIFLSSRRGGRRTECWIRRESLNRWIAARDTELARYMPRPEAVRALGLKNFTITQVAAAGAIRYVEGPEQNFPTGDFFFLREDVMKIKDAFEKHKVPVMAHSAPGKLIALRQGMTNYLGRSSGLAAAIQAVVDDHLVPVGYTRRFRGITGYLFQSDDLRKYRPVTGVEATPGGFFNYGEAAAALGVRLDVISAMVAQGIVSGPSGYRFGLSKLVPAAEIQRFAERYVAAKVLAKRFHLNSGSLARYLRESGTPLLAIPLAEAGRGHAFFLGKDVAARMQLPTRSMLRKQAQLRIKDSKTRWEKNRRAKEIALGRSRRLRPGEFGSGSLGDQVRACANNRENEVGSCQES